MLIVFSFLKLNINCNIACLDSKVLLLILLLLLKLVLIFVFVFSRCTNMTDEEQSNVVHIKCEPDVQEYNNDNDVIIE